MLLLLEMSRTKLLLRRQADKVTPVVPTTVTPAVVPATITPGGLLDVSSWDSMLCCEAV
jgi:hypothetical protein